jgi:hypothetical protein
MVTAGGRGSRDLTTEPRILAGAPALDRRRFPGPGSVPRWFEPFHVRQSQVARGELAAQVAAGADIVVAPAWLTHRRALETVGESRRAREWTVAAVRLAREAVESGLEHREGEQRPVLVAGPLPDVAARPESAAGHLLPASASAERDAHDQAGILADAEVDLVLVERRSTFEAARRATETAADTARPVWTAIAIAGATDEPPLPERLAMLAASGATGVLLEPPGAADGPGATAAPRTTESLAAAGSRDTPSLGVLAELPPLAPSDGDLDAWLRAGALVLGIASGASPRALRPLAEARDRILAAHRERVGAERASLAGWVRDAASRAPGGRALWLGPAEVGPPWGFDWTTAGADPPPSLPEAVFRLVIALVPVDPVLAARLVERGGVVALGDAGPADAELLGRLGSVGLRVLEVGSTPDGRTRLICRREDG